MGKISREVVRTAWNNPQRKIPITIVRREHYETTTEEANLTLKKILNLIRKDKRIILIRKRG